MWQTIENAPTQGSVFGPWLILGHKDKRWIRFGHYYQATGHWYYSATNERSQYGEKPGDAPTHWRPMPDLPL